MSLREYATETEARYLDALDEHGSTRKAAKALGCSDGTLNGAIARVRKRAALQGYSPEHDQTRPVPDGQRLRGVSTLYDQDGQVRAQWVKSAADSERREQILLEAIQGALTDFRGTAPKVPVCKESRSRDAQRLLTVYPAADLHLGMYSWSAESGEDYDCEIAESLLMGAVDRLVTAAPASSEALILNIGDYIHADNSSNRTERSGAVLDVDTRWSRVIEVGIRALIHCVFRALEKHQTVRVRNLRGNHDPHTTVMLSHMLRLYFEGNKRVIVDAEPGWFWYYRWGKVLIGSTHGDKTKPADLPGIMAADRPEDWGASRHRYWFTGHIHHKTVHEFPGCIMETFRTLAAKDSYHAGSGYRSGRDMQSIIMDAEHGEIERHRVDVGMLQAA